MKLRWISIDKCPHGTLSISLDSEGGGTKLLPAKCCGRWTQLKTWKVTPDMLRIIANELECAAQEIEDDG